VETVNGFSACQLAARGLGIALADPFVAGFFAADPSVAVRPLSPAVDLEYSVLRPRGLGTSALVQEFVECVRRHANGVIGRLVKTTARDAGGSSRRASRSLPGRGREQRLSRR
jgi:hypothetical protein